MNTGQQFNIWPLLGFVTEAECFIGEEAAEAEEILDYRASRIEYCRL
jgi:hypothetical protein